MRMQQLRIPEEWKIIKKGTDIGPLLLLSSDYMVTRIHMDIFPGNPAGHVT